MSNRLDDSVKPGDTLDDKYIVERVLGSGGMGVVVQARHKTLNRRVAIKFMRSEQLNDGESVARFQREANAAASLLSEHTARVQDTGRLADGAPYMVMEFLVGKDLGQLLEETGALHPGHAVELVLQACEALAEAHGRGIVHRDIKPRNLFLAQRVDGRPLLKVLDFGLAKHIESNGDHALTRTTAVMGSPQYMSPEQMRASRDVDRHTDIWSLGVCLYELLTGKVPFDAPTVPMLCALVLKEAPIPPHEVARGMPLLLSMAVMRCLEKDPAARFGDVAELADAIEPFASSGAFGSAGRVRSVLASTRPFEVQPSVVPPGMVSARSVNSPGALDATLAHSDTKTAAAFDSKPTKERGARAIGLRIAATVAASLAAIAVVSVIVVFGQKPMGATAREAPAVTTGLPVDVPPVIPEAAISPLATSPGVVDAGVAQTTAALPPPIPTATTRGGGQGGPRKPPTPPTAAKPTPAIVVPPTPPLPTAVPVTRPVPTKNPSDSF